MTKEQELRALLHNKCQDIMIAIQELNRKETKVGKKRLRLLTLELTKLGKEYRKVSVK